MKQGQICHNANPWQEGPVAHAVRLSRIVTVRSRFTRSVSLPRDWERPDALDGYILTPSGRGILERLISSVNGTSSARAWSLTGPIREVRIRSLCSASPGRKGERRRKGQGTSQGTRFAPFATITSGNSRSASGPPLCPVLVTGTREPLECVICPSK
jgi:hypothetical protein